MTQTIKISQKHSFEKLKVLRSLKPQKLNFRKMMKDHLTDFKKTGENGEKMLITGAKK